MRWAAILRALGHKVQICNEEVPNPGEVLVALHARRSSAGIETFRSVHPDRPLIVALTGTDLYRDLPRSRVARRSLQLADRLVLLQPEGASALPLDVRPKARVIYQSAQAIRKRPPPSSQYFDVCVLSHLRPVKDPFRVALAARQLPTESRIRILHVGRPLSRTMEQRARAENARNPRYRWLGERSHPKTLALLARSRLLVLPSQLEGGANVIGEAIVHHVPVLASRIDGSVGLLGKEYLGYFPPGDTDALAALLYRAETDQPFYGLLKRAVTRRAMLFDPAREKRMWQRLLAELGV